MLPQNQCNHNGCTPCACIHPSTGDTFGVPSTPSHIPAFHYTTYREGAVMNGTPLQTLPVIDNLVSVTVLPAKVNTRQIHARQGRTG